MVFIAIFTQLWLVYVLFNQRYLVEKHWYDSFCEFVNVDSYDDIKNPGPIDNGSLFDDNKKLKPNLLENIDYELLFGDGWQLLLNEFSIVDSSTTICRSTVETGMFIKHVKIEIYPLELSIAFADKLDVGETLSVSREITLSDAYRQSLTKLVGKAAIPPGDPGCWVNLKLYQKLDDGNYEELTKYSSSLQDIGLCSGQSLIIDRKTNDTNFIIDVEQSNASTSANWSLTNGAGSSRSSVSPGSTTRSGMVYNTNTFLANSVIQTSVDGVSPFGGLVGLSNLGNTCFMNSSLQCMIHVAHLVDYFLGDRWETEINETNPLGMKGEMAKAFADLMRRCWNGKNASEIPRQFKMTVGRFAPQFNGFQQHDSQELLAFLLDGLHEDLNRVKQKPYVEVKEANGRPDEEVAKEAWDNYLKRNDSIIIDLFHALLKSTLICPVCQKVSITFDPFCHLSLPLPMRKERIVNVTFVAAQAEIPLTKYRLSVLKNSFVQDLLDKVIRMCERQIPVSSLVVADVYSNRFHRTLQHSDPISNIMDRDEIYIYELPRLAEDPGEKWKIVHLINRQPPKQGIGSSALFGVPLIMALRDSEFTYSELKKKTKETLSRFLRQPEPGWWRSEDEKMETGDDSGVEENGNDLDSNGAVSPTDASGWQNSGPPIYTMKVTNTYASTVLQDLTPKSTMDVTSLGSNVYLALDWHKIAARDIYNDDLTVSQQDDGSSTKGKQTVRLRDCLDLFTLSEQLGANDLWYCPQCKDFRPASKKFDIWSVPKILIIHLKRFSYNRYSRDKIEGFIDYPVEGLDMGPWLLHPGHPKAIYDLMAVSNHFGGMGGGHYTAYAKHHLSEKWYEFDDSHVSGKNEDDVVKKAGYVLVYRLREPQQPRQSNGTTTGTGSDDIEMKEA